MNLIFFHTRIPLEFSLPNRMFTLNNTSAYYTADGTLHHTEPLCVWIAHGVFQAASSFLRVCAQIKSTLGQLFAVAGVCAATTHVVAQPIVSPIMANVARKVSFHFLAQHLWVPLASYFSEVIALQVINYFGCLWLCIWVIILVLGYLLHRILTEVGLW